MASYTELIMNSMEDLKKSVNTCDFNAVKLSASTMRLLDSALENRDITPENYYTMVDRMAIMSEDIAKNCKCMKKP